MGRYPVAGSGPDCKSGALQLGWFESNPAHQGQFSSFCLSINNKITYLGVTERNPGSRIQKE